MRGRKKPKQHKKQTDIKRLEPVQMSPRETMEYLEGLLDRGKARDTLHAMQQKQLSDDPAYANLKMRALAMRAQQLEEKSLHKEASIMLDSLSQQLSSVQPQSCEDLARVLALAPLSFGLAQLDGHRDQHLKCPVVERALADRMVLSNSWSELTGLPDEHPLKQDGILMAGAMPDLAEGHWQAGLRGLEALPRKSPFAGWKLFAKAMLSAYQGQDEDLQRALRQLPEDFPLRKTIRILSSSGSAGLEQLRGMVQKPGEKLAHQAIRAVHTGDKQLPGLIAQLARHLYPENPALAERSLAELSAYALMRREMPPEKVRKLIPADFADSVISRLLLFSASVDHVSESPFCLASQYLKDYKTEAVYLGEKKKAQAAIYFYCLSSGLTGEAQSKFPGSREAYCIKQWLTATDLEAYDLYAAAADKITTLAPAIALYYKIVSRLEIKSLSSKGKTIIEEMMLRMQKHFPEDPFSYIQLSRIYRSRGAYRKSQKVLEEAWKQAPYDTLVREHYGVGLLKATIMARNRGALDLARKDLQQAIDLNIKSLLPLINAIGAVMDYAQNRTKDQYENAIKQLKAIADPVLRYRSLICFWRDIYVPTYIEVFRRSESLPKEIHKMLQGDLKTLQEDEILSITSPPPEGLTYLLGEFDPVDFYGDLWPRILSRLSDRHVLSLYNLLLSKSASVLPVKWVRKDLNARLKQQKGNPVFKFYSALADYLLDPDTGSLNFDNALRGLGEEDKKKLKELSRSMAKSFEEPLSTALATFRFESLNAFPFGFLPFDFDEEDEEWDYEEDELDFGIDEPDMESAALDEIISGLERLGSNKEMLQMVFEMLIGQLEQFPPGDAELRQLGRALALEGHEMIRKLREIYSGKKAKRLGRVGRLILFPDQ